ncbi:MAG: CO dehydrogenase/CO-methylating acetyl-CoA synthase complex subunit beta, partial [Candidatus Hodarchaeota archaeon]
MSKVNYADLVWKELPVKVGASYEGERIKWKQTAWELGGPKVDTKFELVQIRKRKEIQDGLVKIVGPKLEDLEPQKSHPLGILIEFAGDKKSGGELDPDLAAVFERRIHEFTNHIQGSMHLNQRYDIHVRISEATRKKGFNFDIWGQILLKLYTEHLGVFEKAQITFITDPKEVQKLRQKAVGIYVDRDKRARELKDEEVDEFYGCVLCQSFAPTHVCVISPQRISSCGALSWFDSRAAAKVDPEGPNFAIPKGKVIDAVGGEYETVNQIVRERSQGEIGLHRLFGKTHTSCGCFEAAAFFIPEVDGFGVVHRDFPTETVNGLSFATLATQVGGGIQTGGFIGIAIEYLYSKKFFEADGGMNRLVWLPAEIKERVKDAIPTDLYDKIATENDVSSVDELKEFLRSKNHPVVENWPEEVAEVAPAAAPAARAPASETVPCSSLPPAPPLPACP